MSAATAVLQFPPEILEPVIKQAVEAAIQRMEDLRAAADGKLAYTEAEAAKLLGLESYQLRDERRRGRIGASVGPGRLILYSKADLQNYLKSRRWQKQQ